jgi:predicted O-methyltransferase YrrM
LDGNPDAQSIPAQELVSRLLADPPEVHAIGGEFGAAPPLGILATDADCYTFLARRSAGGSHTLETGCGISTLVFAGRGAAHTCVVRFQAEVDRLTSYCESHDIDISRVTFQIGWSDDVLPTLTAGEPLDLVLVDGGHGFPTPVLDWYYAGGRLRQGGILVLDDIQLRAVADLARFLDRDGRWKRLERTDKWCAYERLSEGPLREEAVHQLFWPAPLPVRLRRLPQKVRSRLGR